MTRHILLFAALIAVGVPAIPAAAQSDAIVQGQVIAAADRSALPGATVTLQTAAGRLPKEATTDANGRFVFAQVAPDQYVVSVGVDGFEPRHIVVTIEPRDGQSRERDSCRPWRRAPRRQRGRAGSHGRGGGCDCIACSWPFHCRCNHRGGPVARQEPASAPDRAIRRHERREQPVRDRA